jgi:hypothetical protein
MLRSTEASALCRNRSAVATCEHANSALFSTRLQLTGGDAEPEEPCSYSLGNPGLMAPKDLGVEAASPRVVLPETPTPAISVPAAPCRALPAPGTSIANVTVGHRRTIETNNVQFLSSRQ